MAKYRPGTGEEGNQAWFLTGLARTWKRVEYFVDLSVTVAILPEDREDGGDMFLQNVGSYTDYTMLYHRRWQFSSITLFKGIHIQTLYIIQYII